MIKKESKNTLRKRRHLRIRKKIVGTSQRPRLSVYRSNKQFFVQLIDDQNHHTLLSARSSEIEPGANLKTAAAVGKLIAERALEKGIENVVFDRSGYIYHGRIKALAEAARAAGLKF
ncbi:MAG: 50S ribosomal protein L18 [Acholeplasmataceae bacterium]|jgi:large subunit ribosomal protein L18|nr:50S ribosomal protein L18 [Acholeplasmataceae bacterium]